jgi:hypothetical protein
MDIDEFATFRNERINSNVGQIICEEMNPTKKTTYWRLPATPRNYDCTNIIGCVTFDGNPPNVNGQPIPGNWSMSYFDRHNLTKLEEKGNAHIYGYL